MTQSVHVRLIAHRDNPARFQHHVEATLTRLSDGKLRIAYEVHGLNLDLHVPTPHDPAPHDALWRTTCFELFAAPATPANQTRYREFNFSPSGQWARYNFSDTRQHVPCDEDVPPPQIECLRNEDHLALTATLPILALPPSDTWRLALSVILEAHGGHQGYWALAHPPGKPDFHHHSGFVLTLDAHGFHPGTWP